MLNTKEIFSEQTNKKLAHSNKLSAKKKRATNDKVHPVEHLSPSPIDATAIFVSKPIYGMQKRQRKTTQLLEPNLLTSSAPIQEIVSHDNIFILGLNDYNEGTQQTAENQVCSGALSSIAEDASTIGQIQQLWRLRRRWHQAEKSLILQGKALCRAFTDGDKEAAKDLFDNVEAGNESSESVSLALYPFLNSIEHFRASRLSHEKELAKLAKKLPAYDFILATHGIAAGGYASLIGEAGDIRNYKSVAALWKRMGLAVIDGERQRRVTDADDAFIHGYNPSRRSTMWNIGNGLIGGMGTGKRPTVGEDITNKDWTEYQKLFVERCRYECTRNPENMPLATKEKNGEIMESYPKHAQRRAKRYVEKRFLRDIYAQWRKTITESP